MNPVQSKTKVIQINLEDLQSNTKAKKDVYPKPISIKLVLDDDVNASNKELSKIKEEPLKQESLSQETLNQQSLNKEPLSQEQLNQEPAVYHHEIHNTAEDIPKLDLNLIGAEIEKRPADHKSSTQDFPDTPKEARARSYSEEKLFSHRKSHRNDWIRSSSRQNYFRLSYFDAKEVKWATARKYSHESAANDDSFGYKKKLRVK